jgi:hypothetical protein
MDTDNSPNSELFGHVAFSHFERIPVKRVLEQLSPELLEGKLLKTRLFGRLPRIALVRGAISRTCYAL